MVRTGDNLATGFLGPVKGWGGLVPSARSARILPEQLDLWRTDAAADQALDLVEVRALTESMGRVEDAFADFAARLRSAGTLLVDVDNLQSARMLRMVVEGRPGAFDPSGSPQDPNQALPLRRVLAAAAANGLLVRDVLRVPSVAQEFGCDLAPRLFGAGMMPLDWLTGTPPARFWLHCEKVTSLAGSVVIAGGSAADKAATESALRSFLPEDWEVVTSDAIGEAAQWNRGIAAARGDVLWLLRGGTAPSEQAFSAMAPRGAIGPVAPTSGSAPTCVGDVSGMMLPRLDVLFCGPIPEATANTQVALEDCLEAAPLLLLLQLLPPPLEQDRDARMVVFAPVAFETTCRAVFELALLALHARVWGALQQQLSALRERAAHLAVVVHMAQSGLAAALGSQLQPREEEGDEQHGEHAGGTNGDGGDQLARDRK